MTWRDRVAAWMFGDVIEARVKAAVQVVDDRWWDQVAGSGAQTDRRWTERKEELGDALQAWRVNPLARRIVGLVTDFVVSDGIEFECQADEEVGRFLERLWAHPQNRFRARLPHLCDELTRAGELFPVVFTNAADGMSYFRFIPASVIRDVETHAEDYEREMGYWQLTPGRPSSDPPAGGGMGGWNGGKRWKGLAEPTLAPGEPVMLHYAINRPVGAVRGEGDLGPVLIWLKRYKEWLEGRVRLNYYKSLFYWEVRVPDLAVANARQKYAQPPSAGSLLIHGPEEEWRAVQPHIGADDAADDGKALRMMVAAGVGMPPHFLGDPEGATQATAKQANIPTYRHLLHRQRQFTTMLGDMMAVAVMRAQQAGHLGGPPIRTGEDLQLRWAVTDLNREDNLTLAQAARSIVDALAMMVERGWATDEEAAVVAWKFAGELVDPDEIARRLRQASPSEPVPHPPAPSPVLGEGG
ncbi:MAG: hypothetical protein U0768_09520 [Anaerolineae bacterium]